jgi:dolichol-phosphate mannosyltransferase
VPTAAQVTPLMRHHGGRTAVADLSVVVPVYNEAGVIEDLIRDLERELVPLVGNLEVIVVDDASTDDTARILERLARRLPWLDVQCADRNAGHGPSVIRGLDRASAEWIFQIDSDGQFDVADFAQLWKRRDEFDLALGVRAQRRDPAHRLLLSRVVRLATSLLAGRRIRDANTPFRLLRRAVWTDLGPRMAPDTLAPNIFVTVGAALRGWRTCEIPVTHLPRERGTSSLRAFRLLRFSLRGLMQLVAFRQHLTHAPAPPELVVGDGA